MDIWTRNDFYIIDNLIEEDLALKNVQQVSRKNNLPDMEVSKAQGKFLYLLAKIKNAKRILELGTFIGYSTIWLAKAIPDNGIVISLECDATYADIARKNIEYAGYLGRVKIIQSDATATLNKLIEEKTEPFDMIFIDADKPNYPVYLELSLRLSKPGTVIYGDNIIRDGKLCSSVNSDDKIYGVRQFVEDLGKSANVESTVLQTVGIKGYDGFSISIVK
ncbi:MAG: O-methyltransferase [Defluviitaleaceae bacterium]|nr:O-methyltransferase [Defluviitaleaceae bacterium]